MNYKIVVHGLTHGQASIIKNGIKGKQVEILKDKE